MAYQVFPMNYKLTASAVFCAAFISGCSSAPTLAVPTGEWESFNQQPQPSQFKPTYASQPLMPPAGFNQGPVTTVFKPNEVVAFTPPPGSTPVKPAVPTFVMPVEKPPVTAVQNLVSQAPAVPLANSPPKKALAVPPVQPASSAVLKSSSAGPDKPKLAASTASAPIPPSIPAAPAPKPPKAWKVSPEDKTIRETLAKWAAAEGWTFNARGRDYWTVPQDFDVVASDTFYGDFKDVVRKLIASTQLTSTPLQPCFFNNKAVRVILINEECAAQASQAWKL